MSLQVKRIHKTETLDALPMQAPFYRTDEFQVWYYAVLDSETVLVVSSNSCQIQTFDETFNSKYSVSFDELSECTATEFDEVYTQIYQELARAEQKYRKTLQPDNIRFLPGFLTQPGEHITAQAS